MAPNAARVRKPGTAAVPTTASPLLRRKMRRVMDITEYSVETQIATSLSAAARDVASYLSTQPLSLLKFWRTQQQSRHHAHVRRLSRYHSFPLTLPLLIFFVAAGFFSAA